MVTKIPVANPAAPDISAVFPWGLRVRQFEELFFVSGHGDVDAAFRVRHPGAPLAQARAIFQDLLDMLARADYRLDDVIKIEATVTKDFDLARNFQPLLALWAEVLAEVPVKPSGGVLRVVDALALPGMLIEIEVLAAR